MAGRTEHKGWGLLLDLGRSLLNFVYPPLCLSCEARLQWSETTLCLSCASSLPLYDNQHSLADERLFASPLFGSLSSLYKYHRGDKVQRILHLYKYHHYLAFADFVLRQFIERKLFEGKEYDLILAIPLSKARKRKRGYNQALVFAERLAKHFGAEASDEYILRPQHSESQTSLTGFARRLSSQKLFEPNPHRQLDLKNKRILVVDDILTTGSTMLSYLDTLERLGVTTVDVCTIAVAM